jgi:transposase
VSELARQVQQATGRTAKIAFADQGYTGEEPAEAARDEGIELQVVKLPEAKKGFVLLPRRWVVERRFGWLHRFRRLTRDYECLPETLAGFQFIVFAMLNDGSGTGIGTCSFRQLVPQPPRAPSEQPG